MTDGLTLFDRTALARNRGRAADTLAGADFLLAEATDGLLSRFLPVTRGFPFALDLGAHDGRVGRALLAAGTIGTLVSTESCPALLSRLPAPRLAAHEETLPFRDESLDLVVSALTLQWVNDLPGAFLQIRRVLRPDGLFLAAIVGGETLRELREAFVAAESEIVGGITPRVAPFVEIRDAGALLQRAGFALPVVDSDTLTVRYGDPFALLRDLKSMGWSNALAERSRAPLRRDVLMRAMQVYAERNADPDGRLRATFEFIYLSGWAPDESQQKPLRPGTARARLADALGTKEISTGALAGPGTGAD